ncbi:MAG: DUF177 domain-containing protein [Bacillota bacterium]|nr:DUF177 domain-containing protein [Bacillota bacterium]
MYIDVNDISKRKDVCKAINISIKPDDILKEDSEIKVLDNIDFEGKIYMDEDIFYLDGKISGLLALTCSRCLEGFDFPLNIEMHEKLSLVPNDEDDSIIFVDSDKINLNELIENNILMSLPFKKLCSEDCKGLCQSCGSNLNREKCDCENGNVDPRLAKLKDLFFTD